MEALRDAIYVIILHIIPENGCKSESGGRPDHGTFTVLSPLGDLSVRRSQDGRTDGSVFT